MNNLKEVYNRKIIAKKILIAKNKVNRNICLSLRILSFVLFIFFLYQSIFSTQTHTIFCLIVFAVIYVIAIKWDAQLESKKNKLNIFIKNYEIELEYLEGDYTNLSEGKKYISTEHSYTYDLDIFGKKSLFQEMNRTISIGGSDKLAFYLKNPLMNEKQIIDRQEAIKELSNNISWCNEFRVIGQMHPTKDYRKEDIKKWEQKKTKIVRIHPFLYLMNVLCLGTFVYGIISGFYFYLITILLLQLLVAIFIMKKVNNAYSYLNRLLMSVSNFFFLMEHISELKAKTLYLKNLNNSLDNKHNALVAFKQLKIIQDNLDNRNNILVFILLNSLFVRDLHTLIALSKWKENYLYLLEVWIDIISQYDALVSMSNYKFNHPEFTTPSFSKNNIFLLKGGVHPLLKGDIIEKNDFKVESKNQFFIMTGANMSGKSTFLRMVGLNLVLAQLGNVVRADSLEFSPVSLCTSMRTSDSLSEGKSYFKTELLRLKKIHEKAKEGEFVFILLDEILKGTNSKDKFNGSTKFLKRLLDFNVSGIIATHDLLVGSVLTEQKPNNFFNCCFEIDFQDENIIYPYKLQSGISKNMNASFLLKKYNLI